MRGVPSYTDEDFLNGIRASDHLTERTFYDQNYVMVRGLIKKMDSSKSIDIDDLYQDVMVIVFRRIKNKELTHLTAKLSTYVYKTAHNLILYTLRQSNRMPSSLSEDHDIAEEETSNINIDALELMALEMVRKLSYPCNEIIVDWYIHKLGYDEIALKHKYLNANTAKKKKGDCMTKARLQAKDLLEHNLTM